MSLSKVQQMKMGKCLLFGYEKFDDPNKLSNLNFVPRDIQMCLDLFNQLSFDTDKQMNLSKKATEDYLNQMCQTLNANPNRYDSLLIYITTHGDNGVFYTRDCESIGIDSLVKLFAEKCHAMEGKPKIFIIDACQGGNIERSNNVAKGQWFSTPNHSHCLVAHSSWPETQSFSSSKQVGSAFTVALDSVLRQYSNTEDLLTLLTIVNYDVLNSSGSPQMPNFKSSLCHKLYFTNQSLANTGTSIIKKILSWIKEFKCMGKSATGDITIRGELVQNLDDDFIKKYQKIGLQMEDINPEIAQEFIDAYKSEKSIPQFTNYSAPILFGLSDAFDEIGNLGALKEESEKYLIEMMEKSPIEAIPIGELAIDCKMATNLKEVAIRVIRNNKEVVFQSEAYDKLNNGELIDAILDSMKED